MPLPGRAAEPAERGRGVHLGEVCWHWVLVGASEGSDELNNYWDAKALTGSSQPPKFRASMRLCPHTAAFRINRCHFKNQ